MLQISGEDFPRRIIFGGANPNNVRFLAFFWDLLGFSKYLISLGYSQVPGIIHLFGFLQGRARFFARVEPMAVFEKPCRSSRIRKFAHLCIRAFANSRICAFALPRYRAFAHSRYRAFALPRIRTTALPHYRATALPRIRAFAHSHYRTTALPRYRAFAHSHYRTTALLSIKRQWGST
jgi:hypothetical protein